VYSDRFSLARSVSADIDLSLLMPDARNALQQPQRARADLPATLWIPIARHGRRELSGVDVSLNNGDLLPRMPQRDCVDLLIVALVRILRMTVAASPRAADRNSQVYKSLDRDQRSLWCLETAVATYVNEGGAHGTHALLRWSGEAGSADRSRGLGAATGSDLTAVVERVKTLPRDHPEHIRARAVLLLFELFPHAEDPFFELVKVATGDNMLVVGVPEDREIFQVRYDAPLLRSHNTDAGSRIVRSVVRGLVPLGTDYVVDYETTIPRYAKSFHLNVAVDDDVAIRSIFMTADDDATDLQEALLALDAAAQDADLWDAHPKLVEHELQTSLMKMGSILERRLSELPVPALRMSPFEWLRGVLRRRRSRAVGPAAAWNSLPESLRELVWAGRQQQLGRLPHLARARGFSCGEDLHGMIAQARALELQWSFLLDNDPRDSRAHLSWAPKMTNLNLGAATIHARMRMVLADEKPALAESVRVMIFGLLAIVYLLGYLDTGTWAWPWPAAPPAAAAATFNGFGQADAVLAVLLLVPGLLLSRLELPHPGSALGQLRLYPRRLAYLAVTTTAVLGVTISVGKTDALPTAFRLSALALGVLGVLCHADLLMRAVRRRWLPLPFGGPMPRWLVPTTRPSGVGRPGDAHFSVNSERVARATGSRP
jgi:hypothetical protein